MMEGPRSVNMQPVGMLHLFKSNRGPAKDFLLYPGLNTIGRKRDCTVILRFPFISKLHAVIEIPAEGWAPYVQDCGSLNGTHLVRPVRRLRTGKSHHLYDKDLIHFAKLHFQFHYFGPPPLCDPKGPVEVEETSSLPVIREPQLQGTSLAKDSEEEGERLEKDQHHTDGDGDNKTDVHDKGSSNGQVPSKDSSDHGVRAFLPQTASYLQPGSPEKATSSRSQATDDPKPELKGQSLQSDMDNQDEQDSPDVIFESYKVPCSKASAPAWTPRPTWQQKKSTSKWVHSSASPATQESSRLGWGRERGKQSGQGQGHLQASNTEPLYLQYSRDKSGSSFRRETQEPFSSISAPTTSMAAELLPVIPKELSIRAESHQQPPKKQKQGAPRKHVSAPVVPVFPVHPRERSETLKEPPMTFQSQRVVVGKAFQSLQVIPKPSSSLTAEKPALEGIGSQNKKAGGITGSTGKFQPRGQIQHLTLVTNEPSPCSKEQGRGQPQKCAASEVEDDKQVEVKMAGSSKQRETKESFSSSSAPTTSLATKLHSAISKDLPRRTESQQPIPKKQKQGATREHGSTQSRQYMPTQVGPVFPDHPRERSETLKEPPRIFQSQRVGVGKPCESLTAILKPSSSLTAQKSDLQGTGSQSERAGDTAASNWKFQLKVQIQRPTHKPSPCPKEQGRGQHQKRAASEEEDDKPVDVKIAGSSSQRETQEPCRSSSVPTMSLATKLHPAISKELPRRTESHQQIPKQQKQGATREHGSTQSRQYIPNQGVPVLPEHPRERSEPLKEPPSIFQSQRVGVGKTCESFTAILKPSSSLTAQKSDLQGTGNQSERAGGTLDSNWKFQFKVQIQRLTHKQSPCPKEQGRGQPQKGAASEEEDDKPVDVTIAGSSSQRETQELFSSSSAPTTSFAAKLHPAIAKELPRRTESHQLIPKKQKQGATREDGSTQSRQYMPTQVGPVFPEHPRERSEALKEPPRIFQSQRVGVGKTCESLTVILKPSSSVTAQKTALHGTGSQSERAGGTLDSNGKFQPKVQIHPLTLVTNEPSPCPKEQGRGQPQKCAASKEDDKPLEVKMAGSSSQRETKEPFSSSSAPTTSLAAKLHPAISKELPRRTESHQPIPKKQKQGTTREDGSTQSRQYMPTQVGPIFPEHPRERSEALKEPPGIFQSQRVGVGKTCESLTVILKPSSSLTAQKTALQCTGSQSERAGGTLGSNWKFHPKVQIQHLTLVTNEPSPCPKEQGRGQPQKRAASEEEEYKPVEVKTAVKTPKGRAVLTIQPNKEVKGMPYQSVVQPSLDEEVKAHMSGKGMPYQSVRQPSLYEEVRAYLSGKDIRRKRRKLQPTAQEEAEEAGASD